MRIVAAGASGFLGNPLVERLRADGHEVTRLVRRPPGRPDEVRWDPQTGTLDPTVISTADAVINLAGAGVADHRWTARYKQTLIDSRVQTTGTLARAIAAHRGPRRPVLINGSGVGFYGDTGDRRADEQTPHGEGFLPELAQIWEAATAPAQDVGARVVLLRTGLPLARDGGFLQPFYWQFKLGAGGRAGSGRQYFPWISRYDWVSAVAFLLTHSEINGPVNVMAPEPATNAEFARTLAAVLHRPHLIPVPGFAFKLAVGEFGGELTRSQRAVPGVLIRHGFEFRHPTLESALRWAIDDTHPAPVA